MRLGGAIDATGRADLDGAVSTLREVGRRYEALGMELRRPVLLVVEDLPIMGATESRASGHRLHVGIHVLRSGMLDGLIAHEMGHMLRTEHGHPSHRPALHRSVLSAFRIPSAQRSGFLAAAGTALNHVEDIYADDLAIDVIGPERVGPFFSDWIARAAVRGRGRWGTVVNEVTVAFALGNLVRHGVPREDGAEARVLDFSRLAGLPLLARISSAFATLPASDDEAAVEAAIRALLESVHAEGMRVPVVA